MKIAVLGATGRTGRLIVEAALEAGHEVNAMARESLAIGIEHEKLDTFRGDARDLRALTSALRHCEAVLSALGPTREPEVCSATTANVISVARELKFKRYIVVSGAGINAPGDKKDFMGKLLSGVTKILAGEILADKQRELNLLMESDLDWTVVRPPRLVDGDATGQIKVSIEKAQSNKITRADLADFVVRELEANEWVKKAPFVSG